MLWLAALGLYTDWAFGFGNQTQIFQRSAVVAAVVLIFGLKASEKDMVISKRWLGLKSSSSHLKLHLKSKHSISTTLRKRDNQAKWNS